jgi:hypothetical protein
MRNGARSTDGCGPQATVKAWAGFHSPTWVESQPKAMCTVHHDRTDKRTRRGNKMVGRAPGGTLIHLLPHPTVRRAQERRAKAAAAPLAKSFHRCARSPEIERATIEWPCGGALSGLRPSQRPAAASPDERRQVDSSGRPDVLFPEPDVYDSGGSGGGGHNRGSNMVAH